MATDAQLLRMDVCRTNFLRLEYKQQDYSDSCRLYVYLYFPFSPFIWFLKFCTCFRFLGRSLIVLFASIFNSSSLLCRGSLWLFVYWKILRSLTVLRDKLYTIPCCAVLARHARCLCTGSVPSIKVSLFR